MFMITKTFLNKNPLCYVIAVTMGVHMVNGVFAVLVVSTALVIRRCDGSWDCAMDAPCQCEGDVINCKQRGLGEVPSITKSLYEYDELTLAGNKLTRLNEMVFEGLKTKKLDLTDNPIIFISNRTFIGLESSLRELRIGVQGMHKLPTFAIGILINLETAFFKGFDISALPSKAFGPLSKLSDLSLIACGISSLVNDSLSANNLTLKSLNLNSNPLQVLPTDGLNKLSNLKRLFLVQTKLQSLNDDSFSGLDSLEDLDISHNTIADISDNAFDAIKKTLVVLALHINSIFNTESIRPIRILKKLHQLNLAYNQITSLPSGLFSEMTNLAFLNLQGNQLSLLNRETLSGLEHSLHTLLLSANRVTEIQQDTFSYFTELNALHLDDMDLGNYLYPSVFKGLEESLKSLYLDRTKMPDSVWRSVQRLSHLELLSLEENLLTVIPDYALQSMGSLKTFNIGKNKIESIGQKSLLGTHSSLKTLDLHDNRITTLDECTIHGFDKLREIVLTGNPLNCDCKLKWLRRWVDAHYDSFTITHILWRCASPSSRVNKLFRDIKLEELTCNSSVNSTEAPCIDLATTTTSQGIVSSSPKPFTITTSNASPTSVLIKWSVSGSMSSVITGFIVENRQVKSSVISRSKPIHKALREHRVDNLEPSTAYIICVVVNRVDGSQLSTADHCVEASTTSPLGGDKQPKDGESKNNSNIATILGAVLGTLVVLIIIGVAAFFFIRRKRKRHEESQESCKFPPREQLPQFGYGSKRFVKSKSRTSNIVTEGSDTQNTTGSSVATTGASASALRTEEGNEITNGVTPDRASQRYVPELPPRNKKTHPNTPVGNGDSEDHIYDEINYVEMNYI